MEHKKCISHKAKKFLMCLVKCVERILLARMATELKEKI